MRRHFALLLLAVLVLGLFYPTIFAESLSTDDYEMIRGYSNMTALDWKGFFVPSDSLYYYRPMLGLSFYADHLLFDNQTAIIHLENILIHLANTVILWCLLRRVSPGQDELTLLIAIFFGIHPLVTEPVNWISGRTDLMAAFFVLLSVMVYLHKSRLRMPLDLVAAVLLLCGLWSKEVAIGLLPVILLLAVLERPPGDIRQQWLGGVKRVAPFVLATLCYLAMRTGFHLMRDAGIVSAVRGIHGAEDYTLWDKLFSLVKAIGFYCHKLIWPFPLNFAIIEINRPVALAVGVIAIISLVMILWRGRDRSLLFGLAWIACFLAPALPVAVNRVAWTPLAERYLYLPLMGVCLIMAYLMARSSWKKSIALAMGLLLFAFGTATAQRNIVWQNNSTLWADVVQKSPNFAPGHNDYALALLRMGKIEEAKKEFATAARLLGKGTGKNLAKSNMAMATGDFAQKVAELEAILSTEQSPKLRQQLLYKAIALVNDKLVKDDTVQEEDKLALTRKLLHLQQQLMEIDSNPYHRYRIGQLHLALGDKAEAKAAFDATCQSSNDYYTPAACALARKLGQVNMARE